MGEVRNEGLAEDPKSQAKNQIAVTQFIQNFFLPFWQIHNASLIVDDVLGPEVGRVFSEGVYPGSDQEAVYERIYYKSNACARTDVPWPHQDALLLSVAAHDLIALADPKLSKRKRRKQIPLLEQTLSLLPPLTRYDQLVVRWAVLEQLQRCARKDTTVRFWVGRRIFRGRDAPKRILTLPRLRRVRTSTQSVSLRDVWPEELTPSLHTLWMASPVSWLCHAHRWTKDDPRPDDAHLSVVVTDPALRAFVAETVHNEDLSWLGWLYANASSSLKQALLTLALDLHAYGARNGALNNLLSNVPMRTANLYDQRIARPNFGINDDSKKPTTT